MRYRIILLVLVVSAAGPRAGSPCTRTTPVVAREMMAEADLIVRATADGYISPPQGRLRTTGEPESSIRFLVRETVKGLDPPQELVLPGYLSDHDDFNDHPAPYRFVRLNGRSGSCFANTYRSGADFLLVLKRREGAFTVNWYALGPVNEQLRAPDDQWLSWVRQQVENGTSRLTSACTRRPLSLTRRGRG